MRMPTSCGSIFIDQARRFLMEGHKVQIVQNFRGREMMHRNRGDLRMKEIIEKLADISRVEIPPRMAGRRMSVILAPDKPKIDSILRRMAKQGQQPASAASGNGEASANRDQHPSDVASPATAREHQPTEI